LSLILIERLNFVAEDVTLTIAGHLPYVLFVKNPISRKDFDTVVKNVKNKLTEIRLIEDDLKGRIIIKMKKRNCLNISEINAFFVVLIIL